MAARLAARRHAAFAALALAAVGLVVIASAADDFGVAWDDWVFSACVPLKFLEDRVGHAGRRHQGKIVNDGRRN